MEKTINPLAKSIIPSPGYILLQILDSESPTSFSIVDKDQIPQRGKVIAVGESIFYPNTGNIYTSPVKVGDIVIHSAFGYENIKLEGEPYRICPFDKILAIIKE